VSITVERPRTAKDIRALIRKRDREIFALEQMLQVKGIPAHTRSHIRANLRGTKMNRQAWIDYLAKGKAA
jgi:hypothetical protein